MKIHIPAFVPMAKCNEHLAHGPIDIDLGPDVVQVVRCKECKSFGVYECSGNGYCKHNNGLGDPNPDDFCSYGERREDDG